MRGNFRTWPVFRPLVRRMRQLVPFQSWPTLPPVASYCRTCSSPKSVKSGMGRTLPRAHGLGERALERAEPAVVRERRERLLEGRARDAVHLDDEQHVGLVGARDVPVALEPDAVAVAATRVLQ